MRAVIPIASTLKTDDFPSQRLECQDARGGQGDSWRALHAHARHAVRHGAHSFVLLIQLLLTNLAPQMDFKRFGEILDVGSEFANSLLDEWATKGELPSGTEGDVAVSKKQRRGQAIRRNSI